MMKMVIHQLKKCQTKQISKSLRPIPSVDLLSCAWLFYTMFSTANSVSR